MASVLITMGVFAETEVNSIPKIPAKPKAQEIEKNTTSIALMVPVMERVVTKIMIKKIKNTNGIRVCPSLCADSLNALLNIIFPVI